MVPVVLSNEVCRRRIARDVGTLLGLLSRHVDDRIGGGSIGCADKSCGNVLAWFRAYEVVMRIWLLAALAYEEACMVMRCGELLSYGCGVRGPLAYGGVGGVRAGQ
ncbi:unnamed protein product [Dovyalis caffra]|uniref:Uncharacterized protein n=1 Tax=Dovyalis caffra TaxID=77055 RepID=A0AAV1RNX7_9ROSI|nr:unnamed protein product [Dovyalis caffra]